jgi:hypothetical protein
MSYSNIKKKQKEKKAQKEYLDNVAKASAKKDVEKMMGLIADKPKPSKKPKGK